MRDGSYSTLKPTKFPVKPIFHPNPFESNDLQQGESVKALRGISKKTGGVKAKPKFHMFLFAFPKHLLWRAKHAL